jgi:hypothetical protein
MWKLMNKSATIGGLVTKGIIPILGTTEAIHSCCMLQVYFWPELSRKLDNFRNFSMLGMGCCVTAVGDIQLGDIFHDDVFRIYIHETVAAVAAGTGEGR